MASAVHAAAEPLRHVFHVVIAPMYLLAFRVWFARRPPPAARRRSARTWSSCPPQTSHS
jgi:hypothetical protein